MPVVLALVGALLVGCTGTHGTAALADQARVEQIRPGISTMADVRALLGEPAMVTQTDTGETIWSYSYVETTVSGAYFVPIVGPLTTSPETRARVLHVRFGRDGVVTLASHGAGAAPTASPAP